MLGSFSNRLRNTYDIVLRREQQLQAILDDSTAIIYLKDREGKYLLVNQQFEELQHPPRYRRSARPIATSSRVTWPTPSARTTAAC